MIKSLTEKRDEVLEKVTSEYDFGDLIVEGMDGWTHSSLSNEYTRAVYVEADKSSQEDEEENPSVKMYLTVIFKENSEALAEVYAITSSGGLVGDYPGEM